MKKNHSFQELKIKLMMRIRKCDRKTAIAQVALFNKHWLTEAQKDPNEGGDESSRTWKYAGRFNLGREIDKMNENMMRDLMDV